MYAFQLVTNNLIEFHRIYSRLKCGDSRGLTCFCCFHINVFICQSSTIAWNWFLLQVLVKSISLALSRIALNFLYASFRYLNGLLRKGGNVVQSIMSSYHFLKVWNVWRKAAPRPQHGLNYMEASRIAARWLNWLGHDILNFLGMKVFEKLWLSMCHLFYRK